MWLRMPAAMPQQCPVCGQSYGLTHACPGLLPVSEDARWIPPEKFSFEYYSRLAIGIARLEEGPIVGASRDPRALAVGACIWIAARVLLLTTAATTSFAHGAHIDWPRFILGAFILLLLEAGMMLLQYAICHGLAKWWFEAKGTYLGILRAMLMGSLVQWLLAIPLAGPLLGGIWAIAVLMRVFEDVDGIERMKAFALAAGVGVTFWILSFYFLVPRH